MIEVSVRTATATVHLPYRASTNRPGDILRHPADGGLWRVREVTIERFVVELGLDRVMPLPVSASSAADGGRVAVQNAMPNGDTMLHPHHLPPYLGRASRRESVCRNVRFTGGTV